MCRFWDTTSPTKAGANERRAILICQDCVESASETGASVFRFFYTDLEILRGKLYAARVLQVFSLASHASDCQFEVLNFSLQGLNIMADHIVPHFQNDSGVSVIEIGSKEFMCVGANPPFDHPHVFLDLGDDSEIICPYCSTLYRYAPDLAPGAARPPECVLKDKVA